MQKYRPTLARGLGHFPCLCSVTLHSVACVVQLGQHLTAYVQTISLLDFWSVSSCTTVPRAPCMPLTKCCASLPPQPSVFSSHHFLSICILCKINLSTFSLIPECLFLPMLWWAATGPSISSTAIPLHGSVHEIDPLITTFPNESVHNTANCRTEAR